MYKKNAGGSEVFEDQVHESFAKGFYLGLSIYMQGKKRLLSVYVVLQPCIRERIALQALTGGMATVLQKKTATWKRDG